MAYRDVRPSRPCARHPSAAAAAPCDRCRRDLCEPCAIPIGWGAQCAACAARRGVRRRWLRLATVVIGLSLAPPAAWAVVAVARAEARARPSILREVAQLRDHDLEHRALDVLRVIDEARAAGLGSPALTELHGRARVALDRSGRRLLHPEEIDEVERLIAYDERHRDGEALRVAAELLDARPACADDPMWARLHLTLEQARAHDEE